MNTTVNWLEKCLICKQQRWKHNRNTCHPDYLITDHEFLESEKK